MMAPDPLDNNRNWVRAAMGLKYLKEGLESFVENEIINLLTTFLQDIRTTHGLPPTATCNQCTFKQNLSAKCPNKLCDKIVVKIVDQHRFTQRNSNGLAKNYNAPCWKNTDATKWGSSPWEIAKCFMANGYSDKISAKETDCTGILSVLINCLSLQNTLTTHINPPNDIISKMRETRNKIMHSSNLEVTDAELQQYIDDMIDILDDSKTIQAHPDAVTSRTKLNQIKTNIFVISSRDELELRKKAVEAIEHKQKELLEQCQQQQADLQSKLDQTVTSLTQAQNASQQKQADLQSKVDQALTSITQAQSTSQQQTDIQSKLDQEMNTLSHNQAICQQNQKDLQSQCDQTMASLAQTERQCQQKQDDIQSSQGQLYIQINSLQTQMTQVLEVLKKCQLDIDHVRSDLQKGTDKHEEHVKILEHKLRDRQLLQTRLREKYMYQSTIPLSPIMKNVKVDINKVYQKLVIRPDLIHDPNVNKQAKRHFCRTETKKGVNGYIENDGYTDSEDDYTDSEDEYLDNFSENGTKKTINDYRDIFYNKGKPCKNIFVVGNGGVGKTTWCLKLLSSWLYCETNDDFLQRFKYIFYVQLRHTKQARQINDMIKSYLFSDEHDLMNTVNDVLLNEPEHCLVLLDGLDEWKLPSEQRINDMGLPHDPMHSKYTTLITSRPWKLEILRLESTAINKAVEIKGLDDYGIRRLAGHIIEQLNCARNSYKDLNVFIECIRKRKMPMIEVPLMLSIFVYLWYDNDFIGETFAELYGKLTINLFKNAEGDKRRIKQNREISKLSDIKDIETRKTKWSNISISLPKCLSKGWCKSYSPLLYSLGKLAFYGLLSINIESFLVFTQESIEEYMSEEELEVALYIGILSQSLSIGDSTGEIFSISFMHKTIQEFLAAVYMVSVTEHDETVNIKSKFTSYCKQIQNVFEIENILKFVCGMDPKLAGELTRQISIMHKKLISYKNDEARLHKTLLRCVEEEHLYLSKSNHVYIVNHFIKPYANPYVRENQEQINTETLGYIHTNHKRVPMCLDIDLCSNAEENKKSQLLMYTQDPEENTKDKFEYEDAICRCLSRVQTLEKLVIHGGIVSLYNDKTCLRISECINHLKCQTLDLKDITGNLGYIDLSNNTELTDLSLISLQLEELSLPHDMCLQNVELKSIKHPDGDQGRLKLNINNQPHLKHLTLEDITGNVGHIDLSKNSQLTDLTMTSWSWSLQIEELSLPHNGCLQRVELKSIKHPQGVQTRLKLNMNNQPHLKHLTLEDITDNIGQINMSNNSKLTKLHMESLQIEEISLPQDGCLESVWLHSINHPQGDQGRLTLSMNNQPCLKNLTLDDITGNIGQINLSNNPKLTKLHMESLQIEEISLPQDGCLEGVWLHNIKHPQGDQGRLTLNMNNQPYLEDLELDEITGNVGHINLSNNSRLTKLTMTSLQIEGLSLPQYGCLETIKLIFIEHPRADRGTLAVNLNNQLRLKHLTLEDITGNIGHINLSNNSMLTKLYMESLQIEELSLPQDGCLEGVWLHNINHPQGDQGRLTLNMDNQPYLEDLILDDITGNVGHINLSNNSKLPELTMTSLQIEGISLPQNGRLERVKLKSIKHPQGDQGRLTLNMNNQPYLNDLILDDITGNVGHINLSNNSKLTELNMTSLQIEEMSLPQVECLQIVKLKSLKHPLGVQGSLKININSQRDLFYFTLEDISCNIGHIDLSKSIRLTNVSVISVPSVIIKVPWGVTIKK